MNTPMPSDEFYDISFEAARGLLTWYPWVGPNYRNLPQAERILIVGESHYLGKDDPDGVEADLRGHHGDPTVTREAVKHGLLSTHWKIATYSNLRKLLSPSGPEGARALLEGACYYNFIQRVLESKTRRPAEDDFENGWRAFLVLLEILQPGHCLFLGVGASNTFNKVMRERSVSFSNVARPGKVGRTWGRRATIETGGRELPVHFIKHPAKYFSPALWRIHLETHAPALPLNRATPTIP
ncbi:MAG: hypothetical protein EOP84_26675 [Verrucomicrobiaceae bacterium]|nr:MAG: hypothetical protein EOP84_26675 [Verrucomicrobiaceae bacterium]